MKPEDQVCSREFGQLLKDLGIEQESFFHWLKRIDHEDWTLRDRGEADNWMSETCSAFTVAELWNLLPWRSKRMGTMNNAELVLLKLPTDNVIKYRAIYWDEDKGLYEGIVADTNLWRNQADALAAMLIHLKKNDLM